MKKLVVIFLCLSSFSFAQKEMKLSLQEAIRIALVNNIDIVISDHKIGLAENSLRKRKARRYPKLNLSVNTGYKETIKKNEPWSFELMGEQYTVNPPSENECNNSLSLSLIQEIYTGGEVSSEIQEADYEREVVRIEQELAKQDLILNVTRAYWELAKAYLLAGLEEEMVEHSRKMLKIAQKRLENEVIAPTEVERAKAELKSAEYDLAYFKKTRYEKEEELALLLNIESQAFLPTDEPKIKPIDLDLEKVEKEALELRLDLIQSQVEIKAKESALKVARSMLYPKVNLSARYNLQGGDKDYVESLKDIEPFSWDIGLVASWPFYDKRIKEEISEREKELVIAKDLLRKKEMEVICKIRKAYYAAESARERVDIASSNLSLVEENLRIAQLEYKLGGITTNELAYSQLKLKEARVKEIETRIDYEIAQAELMRAIKS
jgi:outer membrane protein